MKQIKLTKGYTALVDDEDYERVSQHKWHVMERQRTSYAVRAVYPAGGGGKGAACQMMHRFILGLPPARKPMVDHINHNGLDNRRGNLRTCSNGENKSNAIKQRGAKSLYKGAYKKTPNRWSAELRVNGKLVRLGLYKSELSAAFAYDIAALILRGRFACINFPTLESQQLAQQKEQHEQLSGVKKAQAVVGVGSVKQRRLVG